MCTWLKIKGGACRAAAARWPAPRLETGAPRRRPISIHRLRRFAPPKYPAGTSWAGLATVATFGAASRPVVGPGIVAGNVTKAFLSRGVSAEANCPHRVSVERLCFGPWRFVDQTNSTIVAAERVCACSESNHGAA